ncbi:MAG: hypothetical protein SWO11_15725 [Thermodesulfobacteriota bacterium]|nr:hypothetical protein [Thermodesulfobacteriota bacterium]
MTATIDSYRYFVHLESLGQKQYEALRVFYVDRLPARVVANYFGYTIVSFNALRHKFKTRQLSFQFTQQPGPYGSIIPKEVQQRIFEIRTTHSLSNYRIAEILAIKGNEVHPRRISRLFKKAGFPPVPRRAKLDIGKTVKGTMVPPEAQVLRAEILEGRKATRSVGGIFLFMPLIEQLRLPQVIEKAALPGSKQIPYSTSFLFWLSNSSAKSA